jgi:hypothetical protein
VGAGLVRAGNGKGREAWIAGKPRGCGGSEEELAGGGEQGAGDCRSYGRLKMMRAVGLLWVCALVVGGGVRAEAVTLYVAPDGNDAWSGRLERPAADGKDGPVRTLQGARDAVRRLRVGSEVRVPVTVLFAEGTYRLERPVQFTPADSGTEAAPVVYAAAPGANVVISGGRVLKGFSVGADGLWRLQIPEVAEGKWTFEQLWVNGRRATRARTPNEFYLYTNGKVGHARDPKTGVVSNLGNRAIRVRPEDMAHFAAASSGPLEDINVVMYHSWEVSRHRVASIDRENNLVVFTGPAPWEMEQWGYGQRYIIENYREALDAPGEWFLARDGTLLYKPLPGEDPQTAEVVAPVSGGFVDLRGQAELGMYVESLTFRGLKFMHGQYVLPPEGHGDGQASVRIGAVIEANGARNVTIEDCEVAHIGTYAVWFRRGCAHCKVQKCYLHDLGAGGVKVGEGWGADLRDPAGWTGHVVVDNCIIYQIGRTFPGAIGVWIGHSADNKVTHNDISDTYYSPVSVGWVWGYGPSLAKRNEIAYNHLHHYGQGVLSDLGAVYTLGLSEGTEVHHNLCHNAWAYSYGGWGLYTDEGSSDIVLHDNVVYDTKSGGMHQHYGQRNIIRNNVFAFAAEDNVKSSREGLNSWVFENNIVVTDNKTPLGGRLDRPAFTMRRNLYWDTTGEPLFYGKTFQEWQAMGKDEGSMVADPQFVDVAARDFRLRPGSPAEKIGFQPIDLSTVGVYGDEAWKRLARDLPRPELRIAPAPPPPPPLKVTEDFELTPVGNAPDNAQAFTERKGDLLEVTEEIAATGKRCLKIEDAPGLAYPFNPHFFYKPNYTDGTARCSFDIYLTPGVDMYHEWRSWDVNPYRVGPTLTIRQGKLWLGGAAVMELPERQWIHVDVEAKVGASADGKWNLTVLIPGQAARKFEGLPTGHPEFKNLTWVGWSSMAVEKTTYYLDNIELGLKEQK